MSKSLCHSRVAPRRRREAAGTGHRSRGAFHRVYYIIRGVSTRTHWGFRLAELVLIVLTFGVVAGHLAAYLAEYDQGPALQASYLADQGAALYTPIVLNKPPLLIWWLQLALRYAGPSLVAARYAVLLVTILGYAALGALARVTFGRLAGISAMAALWLFPAYLTRMAWVTQDLPSLALLTVSLLAAARYRRRRQTRLAAASGAAYGCAVGVHPLMIFGIAPAMVMLWWPKAMVKGALRQAIRPALAFAASAAAVTAAWLVPVASDAFVTWVYRYNVAPLGPGLQAKTAANGARLWQFLWVQHRPVTVAAGVAILLLAFVRRHRPTLVAILLWLGLLGYLLRLEPLWDHYLLLLLPPLSLLIGGGVASGATIVDRRYPAWRTVANRSGIVAAASMVALGSIVGPVTWRAWPTADLALRDFLRHAAAPGSFVIVDNQLFAHLLDENGTIVARLDGPPLDGILPTNAWQPRVTVPTELFLPDGLGRGTYTIQAGMYTWPEEQRLAITLSNGEEVPDRTIQLPVLVVD